MELYFIDVILCFNMCLKICVIILISLNLNIFTSSFSVCNVRRMCKNDIRGFINPLFIQYCIISSNSSRRNSVRLKAVKLE